MNSKEKTKLARNKAILLGSTVIICLVFLINAFIHKSRADKLQVEVNSLKQQIEALKDSIHNEREAKSQE